MGWGWGLLAPKGWTGLLAVVGVTSGVIANISFSDTVTLGSILTAALVVIAGGLFSFRNNMRTFWRNLAVERQEQIKVLEERLMSTEQRLHDSEIKAREDLAAAAEEQRILRHELKGELAAVQHQLAAEHAKTDLTPLIDQLAKQHGEAMDLIKQGLDRQSTMMELLSPDVEQHRRKP